MTAIDTFHAEQKLIENTRPGWWVQTFDDGGSESWMKVDCVLSGVHTETGRKVTFVQGVDQSGERAELREWNGTPITALTAARAKRAGLAEAVTR